MLRQTCGSSNLLEITGGRREISNCMSSKWSFSCNLFDEEESSVSSFEVVHSNNFEAVKFLFLIRLNAKEEGK